MSWDTKTRGGKYYYRTRRVQGRVVKQYVGVGPLAEMAALLDEREREQRRTARLAIKKERERLALADGTLSEAKRWIDLLVWSALILCGWHNHHGTWRRRRGNTT